MRFDSTYIDYHLKEIERLSPEIVERKHSLLGHFQQNGFRLLESERAILDVTAGPRKQASDSVNRAKI